MRRPGLTTIRAAPNPGGYSPIWPPTRLPGCVAWLDCQETLTQAGTVTSITNMVSGTAWTEAVAPPTYEAAGINGRPCMVGNGSTMKIISNEAAVWGAFLGESPPRTALFVCSVTLPVANTSALMAVGNSGVASNGTSNYQAFAQGGYWRIPSLSDAAVAGNAVRNDSAIRAGGQVVRFANNRELAWNAINLEPRYSMSGSLAAGTVTPNQVALLCRPDSIPDGFFASRLGCAILFNRLLTLSEELGVAAALMHRWGIPA